MRAAKKRRQSKRRAAARARSERKLAAADDKAFATAMVVATKEGQPHMEWDGAQFSPTKPKTPPKLTVNVSMISDHTRSSVG